MILSISQKIYKLPPHADLIIYMKLALNSLLLELTSVS